MFWFFAGFFIGVIVGVAVMVMFADIGDLGPGS